MRAAHPGPSASHGCGTVASQFHRDIVPLMPALYSHAQGLTRNRSDAEDLLQDTMLKAFSSFGTFRQGTNVRAWLYRIQTNTFISGYRRQRARPVVQLTDEVTAGQWMVAAARWPAHLRTAEDEALDAIGDSDIASAMRSLPEKFRTVVYFADVEGLPVRQIAQLTKSPVGTVASRLHRGRGRLRRLLIDTDHRPPGRSRQRHQSVDHERSTPANPTTRQTHSANSAAGTVAARPADYGK
jgi:RNA polymerase sigma-70 factor, ECF subfamily